MSVRKEVELIIEQNITKRTRVNHLGWDPCATSTPVRKPLNTLNNFEPGFNYNHGDVIPRNISFKTTPKKLGERLNFEGNSSKKTTKKNKTRSRNNSFSRGQDDEESDDNEKDIDFTKNKETKKNLIIKLGSDEFHSKSFKRTRSIEEVKKEASQESVTKWQDKVICKSSNIKSKSKANNDNPKASASCEKRKKTKSENSNGNGNVETSKNASSTDLFSNNLVLNEKDLISDINEAKKNVKGDNKTHKRKIKISESDNAIAKKTKSDPELEVSGLKYGDSDPIREIKCDEDCIDRSIRENKTKLSTSHEIFSECKERELRDSLDLTAAAPAATNEELIENPKSNHCTIIQAHQKKQRIITKKKIVDSKSKQKLKTVPPRKADATAKRPKRTRKSPNEVGQRKSEDVEMKKNANQEVRNTNEVKETELSSTSAMMNQLGGTSTKKSVTSSENGSSNSFTHKDFFNDIKEMQFTEIPPSENEKEAYSYALGWKFPAFKCGALKIGRNCESSGRTEYENSHFGGVILEGKLLMKIQENEQELSSGQMFCVPPLTDWKATNINRKDCILYYWCGRFSEKKKHE